MLPNAISLKDRGMRAYLVLMTPALARELLKRNLHCQRAVNRGIVTRIKSDIKAERFVVNGQAIIIGTSGALINGQQRLTAVVESDQAVEMFVVEGVPDSAFPTIDSTGGRSFGDMLEIAGFKDSKMMAAAVRLVETYMRGEMHFKRNSIVSKPELVDRAHVHKERLQLSVALARNNLRTVLLEASVVAATHYLFSIADPALAPHFFEDLVRGADLKCDEPVHVLRERLQADLAAKTRMSAFYKFGLVTKTFNAYVQGKEIKILKISDEEPWPAVINLPPQVRKQVRKKKPRRYRAAA